MPKMLGHLPSDPSEKKVFDELKRQLPTDWIVLANVSWSLERRDEDRSRSGYVRDGQADFVVLVPGLGFVVLEVKGSRCVRVGDDGRWYRAEASGREVEITPRTPPEQATHNMHEIARLLARVWGRNAFPFLYAYLVAYPQGTITAGRATTYDPSTIVLQAQMGELASRIRKALYARGSLMLGEGFTPEIADDAARILLNGALTISKVDGRDDVRDEASAIETLSRQQFAALQGIFAHPRVAVIGPAGSGKTVLATWRLSALVDDGKRALLLCFNSTLASHLRLRNPHLADHIRHVDSLFASIAPRLSAGGGGKEQFFNETLPGAVLDVVSTWRDDQKYDAVLIDEGQDFNDLRIIAILELLKASGSYAFFSDWEQDLYKRSTTGAVGAEVTFALKHNCRNTVRINASSNGFTGKRVPPMPGLPEGIAPIVEHHETAQAMAARAWRLAKDWDTGPGRVAILSPRTLESSSMARATSGHGLHLVTEVEDWARSGNVLFSTVRGFKGLEADAVIVIDMEVPTEHGLVQLDDLYVASTRPRTRLALLTRSRSANEWLLSRIKPASSVSSSP
jgi:hypothetical protein